MRLWFIMLLFVCEMMCKIMFVGAELAEGTQVMILNTFNHRDAETVPDAHRLRPERWLEGERDPRFNHLSGGRQYCPGIPLVLLLGKGVLARVLASHELTLERPRLD